MKYRAKVDTVFKFKLVRAGQIITAGSELSKSPNFECIEGAEKVAKTSNAAPARSAANEYAELCKRAKELNIPNWNRTDKVTLATLVAEAEAKAAAPQIDETGAKTGDQNDGQGAEQPANDPAQDPDDGSNQPPAA